MTPDILALFGFLAFALAFLSYTAVAIYRHYPSRRPTVEIPTAHGLLRFPAKLDPATVDRFRRRFDAAQREPHRTVILGPNVEFVPLVPYNAATARARMLSGLDPAPCPRRTVTNTDGRYTVQGWSESTSDRVLAEYVAAELDRVDPL